jgi:hypothetical protein
MAAVIAVVGMAVVTVRIRRRVSKRTHVLGEIGIQQEQGIF